MPLLAAISRKLQQSSLWDRLRQGKLYRVVRHRDFRLLWIGAFVSFIGSWIQNVAQGYLVYEITGDRAQLALVSFCGMIPVFFLGPVAGILADMFDKRMVLIASQAIFAAGALFLAAATYYEFVQYWHILVVALVLGTVGAVEMPTRQSVVGRVVPAEDLPAAIPLNALTFNLSRLVGPAVGGLLLGAFGAEACYLVNGLSFLALIFAAWAIRADLRSVRGEPQKMTDLLFEGFLYTFRNRTLKTLFLLEGVVSIFALFYLPLMPAIAKDRLRLDEMGLGYAYVSVGVGAVLALLVVANLSDRPIKPLLIRSAMTLAGVTLLVLSTTTSVLIAFICFALLGMCAVTHFNVTNTLFQLLSPDRLRGRVLSMHVWALAGLGPFGVMFFGWLAKVTSIQVAFQVGGVAVLGAAALAWLDRRGLTEAN